MKRPYLAGPMTGIPRYNIPAFDAAADRLRAAGYDVVSPAELDDPEDRAAAWASPDGSYLNYTNGNRKHYWDFLERDLRLITTDGIDGIIVLPGWEKSDGARIESFVGFVVGLPILAYTVDRYGEELNGVSMMDLAKAWTGMRDLYTHATMSHISIGRSLPAVEYE